MKHLIDLESLTTEELMEIIRLANAIKENPKEYSEACRGKILATLFYEPSTRTQMSFKTAMLRLGGSVIGFDNPQNSSVSKGESLKDTITVVGGYADIIAIRHSMEGTAKAASLYSAAPVINAGDGGHLHPTQTLTEIGLCGDLKNGRTVHSLIKTMSHFKGNRFVLISTPELMVPQYVKDVMNASSCRYSEVNSLSEALPMLDVLYMTRIQRERFRSFDEYEKQKGVFVLDREKLKLAKNDLKILHPLPRVDEIAEDVDYDSRAKYFIQTVYGMYARMALISTMLKTADRIPMPRQFDTHNIRCTNPNCITYTEEYLPKLFRPLGGDMLLCKYCDARNLI